MQRSPAAFLFSGGKIVNKKTPDADDADRIGVKPKRESVGATSSN